MKTSVILRLMILMMMTRLSMAQVNTYTFTQSQSTYGAPSTGTLIGSITQDDDINQATLPFPFIFDGVPYTNVNVCANGYLSFDPLTMGIFAPISGTVQNIIAAFAQDLFMGTVLVGDLSAGSNTISNCNSVMGYSIGDVISDHSIDFGGINR